MVFGNSEFKPPSCHIFREVDQFRLSLDGLTILFFMVDDDPKNEITVQIKCFETWHARSNSLPFPTIFSRFCGKTKRGTVVLRGLKLQQRDAVRRYLESGEPIPD